MADKEFLIKEIWMKSFGLETGRKVLVHCNQGMSRSPGIGLFYVAREGIIKNGSFQEALAEFETIYPV